MIAKNITKVNSFWLLFICFC